MKRTGLALCVLAAATAQAAAQDAAITSGPAATVIESIADCGDRSRLSPIGEIADAYGTIWTVPAATNFTTGPKATDLYNQCGGTQLSGLADLDLASVAVADAGGTEEFTAYIFADNYFELYVNGTLVAVDPVPFTPFNSNVVRFKADRPVTLAVMGVDWEENPGLGSEANRGAAYHPGDAGFVAQVQDASGTAIAITDAAWRAQTFYTAPLDTPDCLRVEGQTRDSSACSTDSAQDGSGFSAAHWPVPEGWADPDFDDSTWPMAVTFTNGTVGVGNKPAYTNFTEVFDAPDADAQFIWSSNLVLDNLVLLRGSIE